MRRLASRFLAPSAFSNDAKGWNLSPTDLVLQDGFGTELSTDDHHLKGNPRLASRYPYNSFISKDKPTTVNQNVSARAAAAFTADLEHTLRKSVSCKKNSSKLSWQSRPHGPLGRWFSGAVAYYTMRQVGSVSGGIGSHEKIIGRTSYHHGLRLISGLRIRGTILSFFRGRLLGLNLALRWCYRFEFG